KTSLRNLCESQSFFSAPDYGPLFGNGTAARSMARSGPGGAGITGRSRYAGVGTATRPVGAQQSVGVGLPDDFGRDHLFLLADGPDRFDCDAGAIRTVLATGTGIQADPSRGSRNRGSGHAAHGWRLACARRGRRAISGSGGFVSCRGLGGNLWA